MSEAILKLTPGSPQPIYRQVVDQMRLHIESGALAPGASLASVRSVATQLGVHFNTIAEAYRELSEEGWIEVNQGRRAVGRPAPAAFRLPANEGNILRQRLRQLVAEMRLKGVSPAAIQFEVDAILAR